jgi:outer membrane protein
MKRPVFSVRCLRIVRIALALVVSAAMSSVAAQNSQTNLAWLSQPLSLADALDITLQQNAAILRAKSDLEASHGIVVQTRAVALPTIQTSTTRGPSSFVSTDSGLSQAFSNQPAVHQSWNAGVQIVQTLYQGGRVSSALRAARLTKEQSLLQYQTAVADTLLLTKVGYYDVLVAEQQIIVNEASVNLLTREQEDQRRRYEAGTVPRFNVLRAEVAVANQRPNLIRARNAYRIAKNNLVKILGYNFPQHIGEDVPVQLTDRLEAQPYQIDLPVAIQQAFKNRTELGALQKSEQLQRENIIQAKAGYKPSLQGFAGYEWQSSQFDSDLSHEVHGWVVGAQLNWSIFDGFLTRGKVIEARARHDRSKIELEDAGRNIELEVRTAYSSFIEAREVLESQEKVQEEAEESLRLARARTEAGTATQLDVLDAGTALTQARTTQVQALHDYAVARARLERAVGQDYKSSSAK